MSEPGFSARPHSRFGRSHSWRTTTPLVLVRLLADTRRINMQAISFHRDTLKNPQLHLNPISTKYALRDFLCEDDVKECWCRARNERAVQENAGGQSIIADVVHRSRGNLASCTQPSSVVQLPLQRIVQALGSRLNWTGPVGKPLGLRLQAFPL